MMERRIDPTLAEVLESAALLQERVPDAVLVGGTAAARHAGHRASFDHDHLLTDLRDRFDVVLDALEREGDWVTNRVTPGKIDRGRLGEIEAGMRQIIRTVPLEIREARLPSGRTVRVPTAAETLRIKAFLIVKCNQVRDYLDVAALADAYGIGCAARVLAAIDRYYSDPAVDGRPVASQLVRQLADPRPKDVRALRQLSGYKGLAARWQDWSTVTGVTTGLATRILEENWD